MKNPLQLTINIVLALAVAGLYFLHFNQKPVAPALATDKNTAVMAIPEPAADTTADAAPAAATTEAEPAVAAAAAPVQDMTGDFSGKLAYVESGKMLDGYQGMKDARRSFESKARGWEKQNQNMLASFKAAVEAYQKQAPSLTAEQRAASEQKLQEQQQQVASSSKCYSSRPSRRKPSLPKPCSKV